MKKRIPQRNYNKKKTKEHVHILFGDNPRQLYSAVVPSEELHGWFLMNVSNDDKFRYLTTTIINLEVK
ncbi:hypothetical protein AAEX28_04105 [Lentisphaerota bacterium WC36G]|nr:hypothetical protein LJT99_06975 [Lentisphaerae bacterium WC36]